MVPIMKVCLKQENFKAKGCLAFRMETDIQEISNKENITDMANLSGKMEIVTKVNIFQENEKDMEF